MSWRFNETENDANVWHFLSVSKIVQFRMPIQIIAIIKQVKHFFTKTGPKLLSKLKFISLYYSADSFLQNFCDFKQIAICFSNYTYIY